MSSKTPTNAPDQPTDTKTSEVSTGVSKRPLMDSLRDVVGLIGAGAGIFVVLFYLAGRSFANGYFEAMNIPSYQISFSLWEYGEVSWAPLFFLPTNTIIAISFLVWAVFTLRDLLSPLFVRFFSKLGRKRQFKQFTLNLPASSKAAQRSFSILLLALAGFFIVALLVFMMAVIGERGRNAGQNSVLNSAQVELISAIPLSLDDNTLAPTKASGQDYYIYKGFHLLTFNDGKYYLFKGIDPVTCKPLKVYIINPEKGLQINLSAAESLADQCQITNPPTVTATTTRIQSTSTP